MPILIPDFAFLQRSQLDQVEKINSYLQGFFTTYQVFFCLNFYEYQDVTVDIS